MESWWDAELSEKPRSILIIALLLAGAIPELLTMGFSPLTPYLVRDFSLNEVQVGLLGASMGAGSLVFSLPAGQFVDMRGWKIILMAGTFLSALSFFALSLAGGFAALFVVLFLAGAFRPFSDIASTRATMLAVSGGTQTTAVGIVHTGPSLSSFLTSALLPVAATAVGWRAGLQAGALILLPVGLWLCQVFATRRTPETSRRRTHRLLTLLNRADFRKCLIIWGGFMSGNFAFLTFFILHMTDELGMTPQAAGGLLATAQVMAIIGRPFWGGVSDRCFAGRRIPPALFMGVMGTAAFVGLAFLGSDGGPIIPAAIAVVGGATVMSFRPVGTTLAMEYAPEESEGRALALLSLVTWTAAMLLPPFLGWIVVQTGAWTGAWMVAAMLTGASVLALLLLSRAVPHG